MTGLNLRLGWPLPTVRTALELSALAAGWVLGGKVGPGTAIFALSVGPLLAWWLRRLPHRAGRTS